jgi:hypothetical protein
MQLTRSRPREHIDVNAPLAPRRPPKASTPAALPERDPLIRDIRLLGRILGETIREQEGRDAYELVERVRQLSVAGRLKQDKAATKALSRLLKSLTTDQTVSVIRAFSYFSHLANIAEDRHAVRRREEMARAGTLQEGSLALTFDRLAAKDVRAADIVETLRHAYISPVLTAHPTEVQRKSLLDAERAIAELVVERDGLAMPRDLARNEAALRARVTQLWQTRMLRYTKLTVADEIENALSCYWREAGHRPEAAGLIRTAACRHASGGQPLPRSQAPSAPRLRSTARCTFPVAVLGRVSTMETKRGRANRGNARSANAATSAAAGASPGTGTIASITSSSPPRMSEGTA